MPESVADATLVSWHKQPGDAVRRDENLVDLETDKVVLEVPSPTDGVLQEIKAQDGATVTSGDLIAIVQAGEAPAAQAPAPAAAAAVAATSRTSRPKHHPARTRARRMTSLGLPCVAWSRNMILIPRASVAPAGMAASRRAISCIISKTTMRAATRVSLRPVRRRPAATEERVPMTRLRATIARRMVEAQHNAAMLTTFNEVDLTEVIALRARHKEAFAESHGVKLGFMSFFVRAAVEALRKFPLVNASIDGTDILYHDYQDIGIAVSTERGLIVPVLRDAGLKSFADIEREIADFGKRAREGTVRSRGIDGRHLHDHQRRYLRLDDVHTDPESAAKWHPRHACDPGSSGRDRWGSAHSQDDVPRHVVRSPHH